MLRSERLRFRDRAGVVEPSFVQPTAGRLLRVEELIELVVQHDGQRRGELEEAIEDWLSDATQLKLWRGLTDLLLGRCRFEVESPWDPVELRRTLFERSAARFPLALVPTRVERPTRASLVEEVASERGCDPDTIETALYADLEESQRLLGFERPTAQELLEEYNLALCQGLLCHASELRVRLDAPAPKELRQLFRYLRFFQLMFRAERGAPHDTGRGAERGVRSSIETREGESLTLTIDGPGSLLRQSKKYGVKLASFLPALLLCPRWRAEATLDLKGQRRKLELHPDLPLQRPYRDRGTWVSDEETRLRQRLTSDFDDWELVESAQILTLGPQEVTIPDLTLRHRPSGGVVWLEIVGFWRRDYLKRRVEALERSPLPLLVLVSSKLATDETKALAGQGRLIPFRGVIVAKTVIERAAALLGV
ncbi:MAG: DUF790 family protein [Myxococcales bacterium]|nr:DUF790 family protein [Myxococcales bacterium]